MSGHRVLICDDHWIVRQAIRSRVDELPGYEVVDEAGDGNEVGAAVAEHEPDLVILDIGMPGVNGIDSIGEILSQFPDTGILVFTAHDDPNLVRPAAREGARGFLVKSAALDQISQACETVTSGGRWFPGYSEKELGQDDELKRFLSLSPREREILALLATGMRAQGVASEIGIRPATVYTHVRNVVGKLEVDTRAQAVAIATRYSFLDRDPELRLTSR